MKHIVEEVKLKTGASGLLIDVPSASVMNIRIGFRAGNQFARSQEVYEVAHIMEHMAFGENSQFSDEQAYEAEFTKNGAYHNAWTSDQFIVYEAECADFEWERILNLAELAAATPRFNEAELKSEKGNVRSELTGYQNEYSRLLWPKLQQAMGEPVLTYAERLKTISNIRLDDVKAHHRKTHTAKNMQFIIVGNLKGRKAKIIRMLEAWQLKEGKQLQLQPTTYQSCGPILIHRKDAANLSFAFCFEISRRLGLVEQYALGCLNHILTGTMNSKIFGRARKQGIVYDISSTAGYDAYSSGWCFMGEVNAENAFELFDLIAIEFAKVINGDFAKKDIEAAKTYALGRHQMLAQTADQISDYYARDYLSASSYEDMQDAPAMIAQIEKSTIVRLAREFFEQGESGFAVVGNVYKAVINELWQKIIDTI